MRNAEQSPDLPFRVPPSPFRVAGWGMRLVLQCVSRAEVRVDGGVTGKSGVGFLALAGFVPTDTEERLGRMADKVLVLRLFCDGEGKMNLAPAEVRGAML